MKRLIVILLALMPCACFAASVSPEEAAAFARKFFEDGQKSKSAPIVERIVPDCLKSDNGTGQNLCIFNNTSSAGFVILSTAGSKPVVLAYSNESFFSAKGVPDNVATWLRDADRSIAFDGEGGMARAGSGPFESIASSAPVVLHQTARWDQGAPYNAKTPLVNMNHCVTGCLPTALAIYMKFFEYPERLCKDIQKSYQINNGSSVSTKFATVNVHGFNWDNMQMSYTSSQKADDLAELMWNLGLMSGATYGLNSTGCSNGGIVANMAEYMGYSKAAIQSYRSFFSYSQWAEMLKAQLDSHPVVYTASSSKGGHAFILDGYDSNGYFHINWGWSDNAIGYYALDMFKPIDLGTGNAGSENYSKDQCAVIDLVPDPSGTSVADKYRLCYEDVIFIAADGIELNPGSSYKITVNNFFNLGNIDFENVNFGVAGIQINGQVKDVLFDPNTQSIPVGRGYTSATFAFSPSRIRLGDYYLPVVLLPDKSVLKPQYDSDKTRGSVPVIDASFIRADKQYRAGDVFVKDIFYGRTLPSSVVWMYDGKVADGEIVLTKGRHVIEARLTYPMPDYSETLCREVLVD